ncbi:MAG TPA: long-chain fatty acid--CoA ligase [bacterium]|nr:long-chain fatty acid--CoA ligase [bacterium]
MYRHKHGCSLTELLKQSASRCGDKIALGDAKMQVTYRVLNNRIRCLASAFIDQGLKRGDRVAFVFPNSVDYVIVHYAVMAAGGVSVPVDNFFTPRNLAYQIENTGSQFLLFDRMHWDKVARTGLDQFDFLASNGPASGNKPDWAGRVFSLQDLVCGKEKSLPEIEPDDQAMIIYTTGTTGRQKGVMLTHRNLAVSAMNIMERCEVTENDCELTALPQTRLFGLAHIHGYLALGARMMLVRNMILPQKVLPLIEKIGATSFPHVPTAFYTLMDHYPELLREYGSRLRYILMCSAPLKPERYRQLKTMLPSVRLFTSYGLTEAARSTIIELDRHPEKLLSVGTPTPGMTIRIIDGDRIVPTGEEGEVVLDGSIVTPGYWNLPEENHRVFSPHGFRTGDLGKLDEEGFLYIVGRIKDIINVSGLKVNPLEIEEELKKFEGLEDAAVAGFPDEKGSLNEKIVAFYVSSDGKDLDEKALRDHCYRQLESFKVPVHFQRINEIPKTVSGKIQRVKLRESHSF